MGRWVSCLIAYGMACTGTVCWSATGDLLVEYDSVRGTLPAQQGWTYDTRCLQTRCPEHPLPPPMPGAVNECWFQGVNGNDCTLGHGCGPDAGSSSCNEHFNAPTEPVTVLGACTYTEWLAFDDGEDHLEQPFPVSLPARNLTFGPDELATYWGPHAHPAFGAPGFANAPWKHPALRIVTGGGVPVEKTLPASGTSRRNLGKLYIYRGYSPPAGVTSVTLVAKMACGNRSIANELIGLGGFGYAFCVGVDGLDGSATLGRFSRGTTRSTETDLFVDRTVRVALARRWVWGPHEGEFFTLRIILRNDGGVQAWLNEDPASHWVGVAGTSSNRSVMINPDEQAGTMWLDHVRLFEGEVLPSECGEPSFDINRDGRVNEADFANGSNGFADCATGSGIALGAGALSSKCACHDANSDGIIDMVDFAAFQRCLSVVNVPAASAGQK